MLKLFSRTKQAHKYVVIAFALVMGLSLVLFYAPGSNPAAGVASNNEVLAKVGGDEITVGDLNLVKESYQQQFGGQFSLAQLGLSDKNILQSLIRKKIAAREAERLGLAPSDQEVRNAIVKQFGDASGQVDINKYRDMVTSRFGGVQRFEQQIREDLALAKLRAFVTAGVSVSEEEVQEDYRRKNTEFDLVYIPVLPDKLAARVQPSDEELQKYYDEHKEDFRISVPQKNIRYLFIDQAKAGEKLNIPDEELKKAYDELKPENKLAGVKVQQIVFKVPRKEMEQEILQKATALVQRLRGEAGGNVSEEKFAEAARGQSEDPATAKNGGWLPAPVRRNPNAKGDILQQTIDMQPGQVSDPLLSRGAYYIFRRGDSVPKSFEQARQELLVSQRNTRSYRAAQALAARAAERLKATKDLQKVAQELAPEANMSPAEMIKETGFVKPQDDVKDIGSSPQFEEAIAPLNNPGDVGDRVSIKNGFAVPMLADRRDPRVPELAEVKDKVAERFKQERARSQLEQAAREIAGGAGSAGDLKAVAERFGLEAKTSEKYRLGTPLGEAGTSPAADDAIYGLKEGELTKTPLKIGDTWVVVGATKRTDADLAEFAKERASLTEQMLSERRNDVFEDYVSAVRARLEKDGEVRVYEDVLARVGGDEGPALPVGRTFPGGDR